MSKNCPFCKKRIKAEEVCPNCHRVVIEKIEQITDQSRDSLNKKTSEWLAKQSKLTRKWVIGGGLILLALVYFIPKLNSTPTTTKQLGQETIPTKCTRTIPYQMPPEFERALSLIRQRLKEYVPHSGIPEYWNCLNIQYTDLKKFGDNAEGVFLVDKSVSTPSNLIILVDNSYHSYDDLLTAVLLVHEINHAAKHYDFVVYGKSLKSCMEQEVEAFQAQFNFVRILNLEERNSLLVRTFSKNQRDPALTSLERMLNMSFDAIMKCNRNPECSVSLTMQGIRDMVENSPTYQKQCNIP